jgi:hypothetical protein
MKLEPLMTLHVTIAPLQRLGGTPHGMRAFTPISSGTFEGRLRGTILPGGGDWTLLRGDGVLELDLTIILETEDKALIKLSSFGLRHGPADVIAAIGRGEPVDPTTYYFRTMAKFETSAPQYEYLNRTLATATGDRHPTGPTYTIFEIT